MANKLNPICAAMVALTMSCTLTLDTVAGRAASARSVVSHSWAGYVATGDVGQPVSFQSVAGAWTVPAVTCRQSDAGAASAAWIGLGGYTSRSTNVEQVGTDSNCTAAAKPAYSAWFELVPYPAYSISAKVQPGDVISGSVTISPGRVALHVKDETAGWSFTRRISWALPDSSSAEWIVEAPASCRTFNCARPSLANFGSVTIRKIAAAANTNAGTLASPAWSVTALRLVPIPQAGTLGADDPGANSSAAQEARARAAMKSPAGATPGPFSTDGRTFAISWTANGALPAREPVSRDFG